VREAVERVRRWFDDERKLLIVCLLFSLVVRIGSLRPVNNPDAVHKWAAARTLLHGETLPAQEFSHHAARWGVNVPTLAVQWLFSDDIRVYYIPILAVTTLLAALTFLVGKELAGKWTGALAVGLYTPLPCLNYLGSQLMPEMFQACYIMGALWCLLRWFKTPGAWWFWGSFAWFGAAYFAKETVVFFLPGLLLAIWLRRRRLLDVALYVFGFAAVIGVETLVYRWTYDFAWGRATIVAQHHLGSPKMRAPVESVGELLVRYLDLQDGFRELFYAALLLSPILAWWCHKRRPEVRLPVFAVLAVCWSFFLANTFALKSIDPPRIVQPLNERYLHTGAPFLALIVAVFAQEGLVAAQQRWLPGYVHAIQRLGRLAIPATTALCLVVGIGLWRHRSPPGKPHAFTQMASYQELLRAAYRAGVPLVSRDAKRNATFAVTDMFLSFDQAKSAKISQPGHNTKRRISIRIVVDGQLPKYAQTGKKQLKNRLGNWYQQPHVAFSMMKGFNAKRLTSQPRQKATRKAMARN
jgi:hypothetical protein